MEEVIKKWELILQQDKGRDITYGRKVLEEMLNDFKQTVKNCSIPPVSNSVYDDLYAGGDPPSRQGLHRFGHDSNES
jgi:hypothetical protein